MAGGGKEDSQVAVGLAEFDGRVKFSEGLPGELVSRVLEVINLGDFTVLDNQAFGLDQLLFPQQLGPDFFEVAFGVEVALAGGGGLYSGLMKQMTQFAKVGVDQVIEVCVGVDRYSWTGVMVVPERGGVEPASAGEFLQGNELGL